VSDRGMGSSVSPFLNLQPHAILPLPHLTPVRNLQVLGLRLRFGSGMASGWSNSISKPGCLPTQGSVRSGPLPRAWRRHPKRPSILEARRAVLSFRCFRSLMQRRRQHLTARMVGRPMTVAGPYFRVANGSRCSMAVALHMLASSVSIRAGRRRSVSQPRPGLASRSTTTTRRRVARAKLQLGALKAGTGRRLAGSRRRAAGVCTHSKPHLSRSLRRSGQPCFTVKRATVPSRRRRGCCPPIFKLHRLDRQHSTAPRLTCRPPYQQSR